MQKGLIVHTVLINDENRILITKRSKINDVLAGYWDLPGGTLEDGEDPAVGAAREVKEETGLDIPAPRLFFQKSNIDQGKNKQFVTLIFYARYESGDIVQNPEEHNEFAWIDVSEIGNYQAVSYMADTVRTLIDQGIVK